MQSTAHIMRSGCKRKIFFKIYPCVQVKILRVWPGRIWREQHSCIRRLGSNFSLGFCAKRNNFPDLDKSFALLFLAKYEAEKGTSGCLAVRTCCSSWGLTWPGLCYCPVLSCITWFLYCPVLTLTWTILYWYYHNSLNLPLLPLLSHTAGHPIPSLFSLSNISTTSFVFALLCAATRPY